ncbi:vesicle-fusing ATPase-like [Hibiscus syriacus]|uniref:vesicle-fusing ATPase-like n=1 Tax=Hibiscus syriacus TaxID=106335 RepID=UPI0019229225|nr:vesicle-fusing ATPase-like [Hibiscus syriacus]
MVTEIMSNIAVKVSKYNGSPTNYIYASTNVVDFLKQNKSNFSSSGPIGRKKYVEYRSFVYKVEENKSLGLNCVAMNPTQMECLGTNEGHAIVLGQFSFPEGDFALKSLELEVNPPMPDVLKEKLHKLLENQVVIKSQKILMDVEGIHYNLIVHALSRERGIISSNTTLQLRKPILHLDQNFDLKSVGLGGLQKQYDKIYRQVIVPRRMVAKGLKVKCPRGILLYGPPGTGKTALAKVISHHFSDQEAKIIKGPEIFKKFVGESEQAVREIFEDAGKDFKEHGKESKIHVIVFDELDSIAGHRDGGSGGSMARDLVVNQLLTMIDGPDSLDNILVIGTTNRIDLIDPAILRPGRFEVHIKMHLPSIQERSEILQLHVSSMIQHPSSSTDVNFEEIGI